MGTTNKLFQPGVVPCFQTTVRTACNSRIMAIYTALSCSTVVFQTPGIFPPLHNARQTLSSPLRCRNATLSCRAPAAPCYFVFATVLCLWSRCRLCAHLQYKKNAVRFCRTPAAPCYCHSSSISCCKVRKFNETSLLSRVPFTSTVSRFPRLLRLVHSLFILNAHVYCLA